MNLINQHLISFYKQKTFPWYKIIPQQHMGTQCFRQCQSSTRDSSELLTPHKSPTSQTFPQYIDSQGNPLPNAYKRYVKPPTTVGRQSIVVKNLYENEDVPDWIWATQNQGILNSGQGAKNHNYVRPFNSPYMNNRNTYELIEGRFQGVQTVNLSKLQNKNTNSSQTVQIQHAQNEDNKNVRYSVPPSVYSNPSFINNSNSIKTPLYSPPQQSTQNFSLKRTSSIRDIHTDDNAGQIKTSQIKNSLINPFQMIQQNNDRNQMNSRLRPNQNTQHSGFASNNPSVNNSIQRPW